MCIRDRARVVAATPGRTGVGEASIDGDWLWLHSIHVAHEHRRRGLGRAIMADLLDWGAALGARTAWLHLEDGPTPAEHLASALGFRTHHRCQYLVHRQISVK